ncbi:hypothetical protein EG328_001653, partial [Venturia inaequalis]
MYLNSYLLPILLVATPLSVFARGCTHFTTTYVVPCPNKICQTGPKQDYEDAFTTNREAFIKWAKRDGVTQASQQAAAAAGDLKATRRNSNRPPSD